MKLHRLTLVTVPLCLVALLGWTRQATAQTTSTNTPNIVSIAKPVAGDTTIWFHGGAGPFTVQMRSTLDPAAPWFDLPGAKVTQLQPGVFMGLIPNSQDNIQFYRVVSQAETITDLKGWTLLVQTSAPTNHQYFAVGEKPVVTVSIVDTFAQGVTASSFTTLNLYLYGPQDPCQTASRLLNANTDRTKQPHHYINLKSNPAVQVSGDQLIYPLQAVTTEAPGTYRAAVWAVLAADPIQQIMKFSDLQIGTNAVETALVDKSSCAACHQGPVSGKLYMHHIIPGYSPTGNWSLDYEPVASCKACHNNDGYAAYSDPSVAGGKVPDPIMRRVHGVHRGKDLKLDFNTNAVTGDFKDYVHVEFPADVRNCTTCHQEDSWKTQPAVHGCGGCHDNTWFGPKASMPTGWVAHPGGAQADDSLCALCHDPDGIATAHAIPPIGFQTLVGLAMSPPANGKYYVAGETPKVTIQVTNATTLQLISPTNIIEPLVATNVQPNEWKRANLYVSGPRAHTVPVLTTAAAVNDPNHYYANNDFRVRRAATNEDARVTRTATSVIYQLADVTNLAAGTYTVFAELMPATAPGGWAYLNFQVGTTNLEPMVATSCTDCHGDTRMHAGYFAVTFTPDICKSCHDYMRQNPGKTNWLSSNYGFGAAPLSRRVHGVHFGNYVTKPQEISSTDYSHLIFPQDVRNCTKCHSQSTTWTEKPSRLACLACHDDDAAQLHASLMTFDPTPQDPWNGDEGETCTVCHGKGSDFAPSIVHSIANPYVPPYPRAGR